MAGQPPDGLTTKQRSRRGSPTAQRYRSRSGKMVGSGGFEPPTPSLPGSPKLFSASLFQFQNPIWRAEDHQQQGRFIVRRRPTGRMDGQSASGGTFQAWCCSHVWPDRRRMSAGKHIRQCDKATPASVPSCQHAGIAQKSRSRPWLLRGRACWQSRSDRCRAGKAVRLKAWPREIRSGSLRSNPSNWNPQPRNAPPRLRGKAPKRRINA